MKTKALVVTGAGSSLGISMVKHFTDMGCKVLATSHGDYQELRDMESENMAYISGLDLTNDENLDRLQQKIREYIRNDVFHVVNCVGYFPGYRKTCDITVGEVEKVFKSNVLCVISVANRLIPLMCENGGGHFIGFSMHTTYQNYPKMAIFSASKVALEAFIKGLSNEYYKYGVNANIISLSTLKTDVELEMKPQGDYENWLTPNEVAKIVDSLIEKTGGLVNGSTIHAYKYSDTFFGQAYGDRVPLE